MMITRARADELACKQDLEERGIDLLRRDVSEHVRRLKHPPLDERCAAAADSCTEHRCRAVPSLIVRLQEDVIVQPAEGTLDDLIDEAVRTRLSFAQRNKVLGEGRLDRHTKAHRDDAFAFIRERGSDAFHAGAQQGPKAWVFRSHGVLLGQLTPKFR